MLFMSNIFTVLFVNIFSAISVVPVVPVSASPDHWSYSKQDEWQTTSNGKAQSPINIIPNHARKAYFRDFNFDPGYKKNQKATITNNGHTIQVDIVDTSSKPTFTGGGLRTNYALEQFHFHWSSEHAVNGKKFGLEGHFVHYAKKYKTLKKALKHPDGIAVLGVFYRLLEKSNPAFDILIDKVPEIEETDTTVELDKNIVIQNFFPKNIEKYYRYRGSLTTPPCAQVTIWTLFAQPSYISRAQLAKLTRVKGHDNELLKNNFRKIQALNKRTVFLSTKK